MVCPVFFFTCFLLNGIGNLGSKRNADDMCDAVEDATKVIAEKYSVALMTGENVREGLMAFGEKREPKWVPSKL